MRVLTQKGLRYPRHLALTASAGCLVIGACGSAAADHADVNESPKSVNESSRSVPWELAHESDDGTTLTLRYVRFVRLRRPSPDPRRTERLSRRMRRTVKLDELDGVIVRESARAIHIVVRTRELAQNRPKVAMQAFAKEGLVKVRLETPRGRRRLIHGVVDRRAASDAEFLPVIRRNPEGNGP